MLSLKPIQLWKYLKLTPNPIPKNVGRLFYLSWEDGLWDLLEKKNIGKGGIILIPEFYCGDVENNIRSHGYKVKYYPVSAKLETDIKTLSGLIRKFKPEAVVVFHYFGIYNSLLKDISWFDTLDNGTLLIEDCVHRVVDPEKLRLLRKNHFIIDSLRKVMPLQGSVVYGHSQDLDFKAPPFFQSLAYSVKVHALWAEMNLLRSFGKLGKANLIMKKGYDLIGDSAQPAPGFILFDWLQRFTDIERIKRTKSAQVLYYSKFFRRTFPYSRRDDRELVGFPVILDPERALKIRRKLESSGLPLLFELDDSRWTRNWKIFYLPLGPHLDGSDLDKITRTALGAGFPETG